MEWLSSYTFTVYSVGDGLFMKRVLDAIAALSNSGLFQSLGALGLLLGLLLVVMRGIGTGGRQVDLPALFLSLIVYSVMFGGKADVIVEDVGLSPGERTENVYTVDNVPFGVAALGWGISNISYALSTKLEQAYGLPTDEVGSLTSVGFGRTLDWLAAVRFASNPALNDNSNTYGRFKLNVVSYLRYCTPKALEVDRSRYSAMMTTSDPFSETTGIGFTSDWDTVPFVNITSGLEQDLTCTQGIDQLRTYAQDESKLFPAFASAVAGPMGFSGMSQADDQAADAFSMVNVSLDKANAYIAAQVINASLSQATAGIPIAGDMQVANSMMVTQATMSRAEKAAGEESMFRKMIRPMMAFFESLLYIAAPFMALAVGLGRMGIAMVGRYCIVTLWVSLWMPTLTAINMFQQTMVERALAVYNVVPLGDVSYHPISSVLGSQLAYKAVEDWMATGAMLAAATPAITLMLMFGTATAAMGIMNGMQGASSINDKIGTPDAVGTSPYMQRDSLAKHSVGGGDTGSGYSMPSLEFSRGGTQSHGKEFMAQEGAMASWESTTGKQVGSALAHDMVGGFRAGNRDEERSSSESLRNMEALKQAGANFDHVNSDAARLSMAYAANMGLNGGVDAGKMAGSIAGGMKGTLGKMGAAERNAAIDKLGQDFGVGPFSAGAHGGVRWEDKVDQIAESAARVTSSIQAATRNSEAARAVVLGANSQSAEEYAQNSASASNKVVNSNDYRQGNRDWSQMSNAFRANEQFSEAAGARHSVPFNEAAQGVIRHGFGGNGTQAAQALEQSVRQMGGTPDDLKTAGAAFDGRIHDPNEKRVAAALALLNDQVPGTSLDPAYHGDRQDALRGYLTSGGALTVETGGAMGADPQRGSLGKDAEAGAGEARSEVEAAGTGVNAAAVEGDVRGAHRDSQTPEGRAAMGQELGSDYGMGGVIGSAQSGGSRGLEMNNGDGTVNETHFAQHASDTAAAGHENATQVFQTGKDQVTAAQGQMAAQSWAVDPTHSNDNSQWMQQEGGSRSGGATNLQAVTGKNADGSPNQGPDNPYFEQSVQNGLNGGITGGFQQNSDMATVLGGIQATKRHGGSLSAEQGAQWQASYDRLSPQEKSAVNHMANNWDHESPVPKPTDSPVDRAAGQAAPSLNYGGSTGPGSEKGQGMPGVPATEGGGRQTATDGVSFGDERTLNFPKLNPSDFMFTNTNTDMSLGDRKLSGAMRGNDDVGYLRADQPDRTGYPYEPREAPAAAPGAPAGAPAASPGGVAPKPAAAPAKRDEDDVEPEGTW